jgi:hypothetical protein
MRAGITGLIVGLIFGFGIGALTFRSEQPTIDLTQHFSPELKALIGNTWATNAILYRSGKFNIFAPADDLTGDLNVIYGDKPGVGGIFIMDRDTNGVPDYVTISDNSFRSVSVEYNSNTEYFTSVGFSTGISTSSVSYVDQNCDGQYDSAFGPGNEFQIWIEGQWFGLIKTNNLPMIRRNDQLVPVAYSNKIWHVVD